MQPNKVEGLISEHVEHELLVFNPATAEGHALNGAAAAVFQMCDGGTDRAAMAAALAAGHGLPDDVAVVELALAELHDAGLVLVDDLPVGLSRRSVIRKLGMSLVAAAALPVIETMFAGSAAAQHVQPAPAPKATTRSRWRPSSAVRGCRSRLRSWPVRPARCWW